MRRAIITPATAPLLGTLTLPGDKSISHRYALLSLFVNDDVKLSNYSMGEDGKSTLNCLERLGKTVTRTGTEVVISGGIEVETADLDCGNSGTTARLLMGILSAQKGSWVLRGDDSLSRRPMERVAEPLRLMGARIESKKGCLPARIEGTKLHGITFDSPVASAQVKSAMLFAGLNAEGVTRYREPLPTRDHTERILDVAADKNGWITLDPGEVNVNSQLLSASIPADPSAAAFWIAAALMVPDSRLSFASVLANPHRIEYVELLLTVGAKVMLFSAMSDCAEEAMNIEVNFSPVTAITTRDSVSAKVIDEIPVLAVLAAQIEGTSEFADIGELRFKESDRLRLIAENLRRMGVEVSEYEDGLAVKGTRDLIGAEIVSGGDHRIAMAFAIAGMAARGLTVIDNADCVNVSYPGFWEDFQTLAPGSLTLEQT